MLTVDVALQVATLQESVTVTSESPLVDTQSTSVGYVQTTAQLIGVPTSTDLWGALAQTPGVRMGGVDVGGSHKSQQSGYEAYGIRNQARVDQRRRRHDRRHQRRRLLPGLLRAERSGGQRGRRRRRR